MAERSDIELLEDLLARENRLLSAYKGALRRDAIDAQLGEMLLEHEREHAAAIERALAGAGRRNPRASVPSPNLSAALRSRTSFGRYMIDLEGQTVAAYTEAAASIRDASLRQPLGSIMACGAAHVVALKDSLGDRFLTN
jgi:ferritin-like protein